MNYQLSVYCFFSILSMNQLFKSTGFPDEQKEQIRVRDEQKTFGKRQVNTEL